MSREKLRIAKTATDNLMSNLRGEVAEVITTWVLMGHFMAEAARLRSSDPEKDLSDRPLSFVNLLIDKLRDELVSRLSELAEEKIGRLTFYFAAVKLGRFQQEAKAFTRLMVRNKLREKRNQDISHKELPERWSDHRPIHIPYRILLRALAAALWLMKRIDRWVLGPSAPDLWHEARKRRYTAMYPPRVGYMLVPYLHLSAEDRLHILAQEVEGGAEGWSEMSTTVDGTPATVFAGKKWGILALGGRWLVLDQYPLRQLTGLTTHASTGGAQDDQSADQAADA